MVTLADRRCLWEAGKSRVRLELPLGDDMFLVVRSPADESGEFILLRYFTVGDNWEVSADSGTASLDQMFEWLQKCSGL